MKEPLAHFLDQYPFQRKDIKHIHLGEKYLGVELQNGKLGVCATLENKLDSDLHQIEVPDLENISHRILLNAWFNSKLNEENQFDYSSDIFDKIDFKHAGNVVMVGFFQSLTAKFHAENIPLTIFDLYHEGDEITPLEKQQEFISKSDTLILTSTSVFNRSFLPLVESTPADCTVYLLGPSTILHTDMFKYRNIKLVFGSIFPDQKEKVIETILAGEGTPVFSKYMKKVFLEKQNG